jgi:hypothetical protein
MTFTPISGFATETTLKDIDDKIHNDVVNTDAIQVQIKNIDLPVSNASLDTLSFSGTSLNTAVTNTVPVSNASLTNLSFSGTSLNTAVTNTVPVSNASLDTLSFSGTSLNTAVTNTVPVSNASLSSMTFSGGSLNVSYSSVTPITTSLPAINYDAFGRFRVSTPFTLFDSSNRYADNGLWAGSITGGATYNFNANQGLMDLTVPVTADSEAIRETYKVFPYQPGKSLLVLNTFVGITTAGVRQRIGYFGTENGIYFQINETGISGQTKCSIFKRSKVSGVVVDTEVLQSAWNGDKLNGSGPSGITLNLENAQILWMDFEWLGVGSVRVGFVINGQFILCHTFQHANIIQSTYITTASLPLRYEIKNISGAGGNLKQICSTVISEGGYGLNGTQLSIATLLTAAANMDTTIRPVISIRLQSTRLDAIVILTAMNLIPSSASNDTFFWEIIRGGVTGPIPPSLPAWVPYTNSSVETRVYGATGGTITGGIVMASGFFSSTNQSRGSILLLKDSLFTFQLQRDSFTNTAYEITLCCKSASSGNVFGSIDWEEVSR